MASVLLSPTATRLADGQTRYPGTVRWFAPEYGHGFITDDVGEDWFFRFSDLDDMHGIPSAGNPVTFVGARDSRGLRARSVASA